MGSILRDDFRAEGEDPSDIDVLYLFTAQANYGLEIFEMQAELEALFDRKVDFVSKKAILNSRNWLRRQNILNSHRIIYRARCLIAYRYFRFNLSHSAIHPGH